MHGFFRRLIGAMRLDASAYEDVEADPWALPQAITVVVVSSAASGLGLALDGGTEAAILGASAAQMIYWFIMAGLTFLIGTRILPTPETSSTLGELLRTTGFSAAPGVFRAFSAFGLIGTVITFGAYVWMLAAFVVAVRQALDYRSTWRAVAVCLTGAIVFLILVLFRVAAAL